MSLTWAILRRTVLAALLIAAVVVVLVVPRVTAAPAHEMKILFPTADGLVPGSDVLEAGTRIGTITDIDPLQNKTALVTISVSGAHWPLHDGLFADIRPKSLLGEKYVDLHDGPQNAPPYAANAVLHASSTSVPVELDQFINSLDPATRTAVRVLINDLGGGLTGQGDNLNAAIAAGRADLAHLAVFGQTLNDRDPDLDRILVGLDGALRALTTNDELSQLSQLITNGQNTLNDIESVQQAFSRQFTDANLALGDLNTALGGAIPNLRTTLNIAPSLIATLRQETDLLTPLARTVTTSANKSPNGECTSSSTAPQPISQVTGLAQCSPLWMLIRGLISGPTSTGGAIEQPSGEPIFRVCISGITPQLGNGECDNGNAEQGFTGAGTAHVSGAGGDGQLLAAMLGT